jgi:hypothetical protein
MTLKPIHKLALGVTVASIVVVAVFFNPLLKPRAYCYRGQDCWEDFIQAVFWHTRSLFAAMTWLIAAQTAAVGLLSFVGLVLERPTNGSPTLSARGIAERLIGPWKTHKSGCLYPHPQRRVRVAVETNSDWEVLQYEDRDPRADSEDFAQGLLAIMGDELCANDELALVRALAERLTDWQVRRGCEDDPVLQTLEELLTRHREATLASGRGGGQ